MMIVLVDDDSRGVTAETLASRSGADAAEVVASFTSDHLEHVELRSDARIVASRRGLRYFEARIRLAADQTQEEEPRMKLAAAHGPFRPRHHDRLRGGVGLPGEDRATSAGPGRSRRARPAGPKHV